MGDSQNPRSFAGTAKELTAISTGHSGLVVVDFGAAWCPPCLKVGDLLRTLAAENPRILFLRVDVESCRELQVHYQVNSIPHLKSVRAASDRKVQDLASVIGADVTQIRAKISQFA
jgi:thiol-disulfide isomerase/thioredoxin